MAMTDGVVRMRRLEQGLEIGAGQSVELKPGGHHLMFMGLGQPLEQGRTLAGTLIFDRPAPSPSTTPSPPSARRRRRAPPAGTRTIDGAC